MLDLVGVTASHAKSGEAGVIDATVTHPDDAVLVRINDRWFFLKDCTIE